MFEIVRDADTSQNGYESDCSNHFTQALYSLFQRLHLLREDQANLRQCLLAREIVVYSAYFL